MRVSILAVLVLCSGNVFGVQSSQKDSHAVIDKRSHCDGPIAQLTRQLWNAAGHAYAQETLKQRLVEQGDTYVLYDLQIQFHNLLAMAERCGDVQYLRQMAQLAQTAYTRLEPVVPGSQRWHWVCRGGGLCNAANRLINTEVMLISVQFLGFASNVANALHAIENASDADKQFAQQTAHVAIDQLLRWGNSSAVAALYTSQKATLDDVKDGSTRYLLTDRVLWQLTVFAHLAGMFQRDPEMLTKLNLSTSDMLQLRTHAAALSAFVQQRTQVTTVTLSSGSMVEMSDLDAGYWRHFKDNRYAAYEGADKPAVCGVDGSGAKRVLVKLPPESVPIRNDIGWDLSHARRLVQYFDSIESNRAAIQSVWKLAPEQLPNRTVMKGFAHKLLGHVWNQDSKRPLFSNYLSGANGWYRVAYDNGTGLCREGYPPHGLSDAFPTGGYVTWGQWVPQLHTLGLQIFSLAESIDPEDKTFMARHYSGLSGATSANVLLVRRLMFWPTLVTHR